MKTTATLGEWMVLGGVAVGAYALYLTYQAAKGVTVASVVDAAATAVDRRSSDSSILGAAQRAVANATSHWGDTYYRADIITPDSGSLPAQPTILDTIGGP